MMDASPMYPNGFHPMARSMDATFARSATYFSRTERPPRYYWTDFDLSIKYDHDGPAHEMEGVQGADGTIPELLRDEYPYDPFAADVYIIGNMIRRYFTHVSFHSFGSSSSYLSGTTGRCKIRCIERRSFRQTWLWVYPPAPL